MKEPVSYEEYTQRCKYQEFIKKYLTEQGIPLKPWEAVKPLYLRYRARCLKLKPETYQQFLNLCTFESTRAGTKYTDKGALKEGKTAGWNNTGKKETDSTARAGMRDRICRVRKDYKLNYKAPPKKEDFEVATDWRIAYKEWSYLKDELADYEGVKALVKEFENERRAPAVGETNPILLKYPWLIRYALKCLGGTIPKECYPDSLSDYREELQSLLDKQKEMYASDGSETILNDLTKYLGKED